MPQIRDLKGKVIEPESPGLSPMRLTAAPVEPPAVLPDAAREAMKAIRARHEAEGPREAQRASSADDRPAGWAIPLTSPRLVDRPVAPLPEDMEAAILALAGSAAMLAEYAKSIMEAVALMQSQLESLRARAHADAGKLAKVNAALKALSED